MRNSQPDLHADNWVGGCAAARTLAQTASVCNVGAGTTKRYQLCIFLINYNADLYMQGIRARCLHEKGCDPTPLTQLMEPPITATFTSRLPSIICTPGDERRRRLVQAGTQRGRRGKRAHQARAQGV